MEGEPQVLSPVPRFLSGAKPAREGLGPHDSLSSQYGKGLLPGRYGVAGPGASPAEAADVSCGLSPKAVSKEPAGERGLTALSKWCICQKKSEPCYDLVTVA